MWREGSGETGREGGREHGWRGVGKKHTLTHAESHHDVIRLLMGVIEK